MAKKHWIAGAVLLAVVGYLAFTGFTSSSAYYYKVDEVLAKGDAIKDQNIRVDGTVVPGSVVQDGLKLTFDLADAGAAPTLEVIYEGAVPGTFKEGAELNLAGSYDGNGLFTASQILTKCASKYSPVS